jgi:hypothetical protein
MKNEITAKLKGRVCGRLSCAGSQSDGPTDLARENNSEVED